MKQIAFISILFLSACSNTPLPTTTLEVNTVEVQRPAPIVPRADILNLREINWVVLTADNIDEEFQRLSNSGREAVFFALTADGYENLALNLNDINTLVRQQNTIIGVYERSYER